MGKTFKPIDKVSQVFCHYHGNRSVAAQGGEGMSGTGYPRDLVGYGPNPPKADWPGGARIAVQCVLICEPAN